MRNLNGLIWVCVLALFCGTANAQIKIVIDNQAIPTEDIKSIVILPNSNLISVSTNVAYSVQAMSETDPQPTDAVTISGFSASATSLT